MKDKRFFGKRILIFEGGARQSLPFIRAFRKLGCVVSVLCNSKLDVSYVSRLPKEKILGFFDEEDLQRSEETLLGLLQKKEFDLILPMSDFAAYILAKNQAKINPATKTVCNTLEVFEKSIDKLNVMDVCMKNEIPCPVTLLNVKTLDDVWNSGLCFPILIKPREKSGARGLRVFSTKEEMASYITQNEISLEDYVVQEYIPEAKKCYSANVFVDRNGEIKSNFVYQSARWYPIHGGTGTLNISVAHPEAIRYSNQLVQLMGIRGCCGVDLIEDPRDGALKVLEINPRILACAKLEFLAGVNLAEQILEDAFGEEVTEYQTYKTGIRVRVSQIDLLWFLKSPDRFRAKPNFFSPWHTRDQLFAFDDPLPWFAFLISGMKKYKKQIGRKEEFRN